MSVAHLVRHPLSQARHYLAEHLPQYLHGSPLALVVVKVDDSWDEEGDITGERVGATTVIHLPGNTRLRRKFDGDLAEHLLGALRGVGRAVNKDDFMSEGLGFHLSTNGYSIFRGSPPATLGEHELWWDLCTTSRGGHASLRCQAGATRTAYIARKLGSTASFSSGDVAVSIMGHWAAIPVNSIGAIDVVVIDVSSAEGLHVEHVQTYNSGVQQVSIHADGPWLVILCERHLRILKQVSSRGAFRTISEQECRSSTSLAGVDFDNLLLNIPGVGVRLHQLTDGDISWSLSGNFESAALLNSLVAVLRGAPHQQHSSVHFDSAGCLFQVPSRDVEIWDPRGTGALLWRVNTEEPACRTSIFLILAQSSILEQCFLCFDDMRSLQQAVLDDTSD